jgi:hypothetical protein
MKPRTRLVAHATPMKELKAQNYRLGSIKGREFPDKL